MEMNDAVGRLLAALLEARTGQRLQMNRRWRIETALGSLMRDRGLAALDDLIALILNGQDSALTNQVVEALLNNETFFFRDRHAFDLLLGPALDRFAVARATQKSLSIWCAGCSTGQEAYSVAMSFAANAPRWEGWRISILGTDVSRAAITQARAGLYSQFEVQRGLPVQHMLHWFEQAEGNWKVVPSLREAVRFAVHNVSEAPPAPGQFDIILCRNVLLYLSPERRRAVFDRLAEASVDDSILMLGAGETVIGQTEQYVSDPACRGLYVRPAAAQFARAVG